MNRPSRKAKEKTLLSRIQQKRLRTAGVYDTVIHNCVICLEKVSTRGLLSVCDHWFCFICVYEWSKKTNTCPLCKTRFRAITKVHVDGRKSPRKIFRVRDKEQSFVNYADDDYEVAMGMLSESETDEDRIMDETFEPPQGYNEVGVFLPRRRRRSARRSARLNVDDSSISRNSTAASTAQNGEELSSSVDSPGEILSSSMDNSTNHESSTPTSPRLPSSMMRRKKKRRSIVFQPNRRSRRIIQRPTVSIDGWIDMSQKQSTLHNRTKKVGFANKASRESSDEDVSSFSDGNIPGPSRSDTMRGGIHDSITSKQDFSQLRYENKYRKDQLHFTYGDHFIHDEKEVEKDHITIQSSSDLNLNISQSTVNDTPSPVMKRRKSVRFDVKAFLDSDSEDDEQKHSDSEDDKQMACHGQNVEEIDRSDILNSPIASVDDYSFQRTSANMPAQATMERTLSDEIFHLDNSDASLTEISPCVLSSVSHFQSHHRKGVGIRTSVGKANSNMSHNDSLKIKYNAKENTLSSYMNVTPIESPPVSKVLRETYRSCLSNQVMGSSGRFKRTKRNAVRSVRLKSDEEVLRELSVEQGVIANTPQRKKFKSCRWK